MKCSICKEAINKRAAWIEKGEERFHSFCYAALVEKAVEKLQAENERLKATVEAKEKTLLNYEDAIEELVLENRQLKESE